MYLKRERTCSILNAVVLSTAAALFHYLTWSDLLCFEGVSGCKTATVWQLRDRAKGASDSIAVLLNLRLLKVNTDT